MTVVSISVTSPTRPSRGSRCVARDEVAVVAGDADREPTVDVDRGDELWLTLPTSTILTTSIASSVVTRRPS